MDNVLEIKTTKKYGRGLFATRKIRKGEVDNSLWNPESPEAEPEKAASL